MTRRLATIVVVPRERFSFTQRSLESLVRELDASQAVVYVDAGSPPDVRAYLRRQAAARGFRLLRRDGFLAPNAARNLAMPHVRTKYVVFVDNDVLFSDGWLDALVACAEETGAAVVGPVYCEREPMATRIHMAGGAARFEMEVGRRVFREWHYHYGEPLASIAPRLERGPVEQVEYHCVLVRTEALARFGPLDEGIKGVADHTDLCLSARAAGGAVYLEPRAVVTWVPPPPFRASDLPFFRLRWSEAWTDESIERFRTKWNLEPGESSLESVREWVARHRRTADTPALRVRSALASLAAGAASPVRGRRRSGPTTSSR